MRLNKKSQTSLAFLYSPFTIFPEERRRLGSAKCRKLRFPFATALAFHYLSRRKEAARLCQMSKTSFSICHCSRLSLSLHAETLVNTTNKVNNVHEELKSVSQFLTEYATCLMASGVHTSRIVRNTARIAESFGFEAHMTLFHKTISMTLRSKDNAHVYRR